MIENSMNNSTIIDIQQLQKEYEAGNIATLSIDEKESLKKLYEKQITNLENEFEEYRKRILKIKGKIEKKKLIKNTNLRKSGF